MNTNGGNITWILEAETINFNNSMQSAENKARTTADTIDKSLKNATDSVRKNLQGLATEFEQVGRNMTLYVSAPIAAGFAASVKSASTFQNSMSLLTYTTGATADQVSLLSEKARELGRDNTLAGVTASDAATSMIELSKAGLGLNDTLAASRGVLSLAKAGQIDFATAANITAGALNAFKLSGDEAGHVADVLANGANKSQASLHDLGLGLQASASVAQLFGLGLEENVTALAIFANNGIRASDAGTSLKTMLLSIATPSKEAAGLMEQIGFSAYDTEGNFVGLREVSMRLAKSLEGLTEEQRTSTLATIFGSDATRAASLLASNAGENYDKMAASIGQSGTAVEMARAMMAPYSRALESMGNVMADVGLVIGGVLMPPLIRLYDAVRKGGEWFIEQNSAVQGAFVVVGLLAASLGPLLIGMSLLFRALDTGIVVWGRTATAVNIMRASLISLRLGMAGTAVSGNILAVTLNRVALAARGVALSFMAIPVLGWIALAVTALAGLLIMFKTTETGFEQSVKNMASKVPGILDTAINFVTTKLPVIFSNIVNVVMTNAPKVIASVVSMFQSVVSYIATNGPALLNSFLNVWSNVINTVSTFIMTNAPMIFNAIAGVIQGIIAFLIANGPAIITTFIKIVTSLADVIASNAYKFITLFSDLLVKVITTIAEHLPMFVTAGVNLLTKIIEGIVTVLPVILQTMVDIIIKILTVVVENLPKLLAAGIAILTAIITGIISMLPTLLTAALDIVLAIVLAIVENLPMIIDAAIQLIMAIFNALVENLPVIIDAAIQIVMALINGLIQVLPQLVNAALYLIMALVGGLIANLPLLIAAAITLIIAIIGGLISMIPALISAAFQLVVAIVSGLIQMVPMLINAAGQLIAALIWGLIQSIGKVISGAVQIGKAILDEINRIPGRMLDAGVAIVQGLWNGISNTTGWIIGKVKSFGGSVLSGIKDFFGIRSPSRVMAEMGKYMIQGFGNGIADNAKLAVSAATRASESILGAFGSADNMYTLGVNANAGLAPGSLGDTDGYNSATTGDTIYNIELPNVKDANDFAREFKLAMTGRDE